MTSGAARYYDSVVRRGTHDMRGHVETLHRLVRWLDAQQVIELGVRKGNSTAAILAALDHTGGKLWSCDIRPAEVPGAIRSHPAWTFCMGDDRLASAPDSCDLLFIDTSHTFRHTQRELKLYGPKVKRGAIVLHDISLAGVSRSVAAWLDAHPDHAYIEDRRSHGLGVILT